MAQPGDYKVDLAEETDAERAQRLAASHGDDYTFLSSPLQQSDASTDIWVKSSPVLLI